MSKIIEVLVGVSMVKQHQGLYDTALKHRIRLDKLPEGSAVLFISRDRCRMKVISWNGVLSYIRSPNKTRPFSLDAVDEFPRALSKNGTFDYEKALKAHLEKAFASKDKLDEKRL